MSIAFCNRESRKVIKGDILDIQMLDDGAFPHVCLTLNTGYNILIELETIKQINKFLEEERGI